MGFIGFVVDLGIFLGIIMPVSKLKADWLLCLDFRPTLAGTNILILVVETLVCGGVLSVSIFVSSTVCTTVDAGIDLLPISLASDSFLGAGNTANSPHFF